MGRHDEQPRWLGGEAHVRRQQLGSSWDWDLPPRWRSPLAIVAAFAAGAAAAGTGAALARHGREEEPGESAHDATRPGFSAGTALAAFVAGALLAGAAVLLTAPESGPDVRRRLARGARTAQEELSDIVEETRTALEGLKKDARQTLRRTALRLADSIDATITAVKHEGDRVAGPTHD